MKFRFDVLDAIKKLAPDYIFIVSNQDDIKRRFINNKIFKHKAEYITSAIGGYCNINCYYAYCTSNDPHDINRKPNTGLLKYLIYTQNIEFDKKEILMIGDASGKKDQCSDIDKRTAENFDIDYLDVEDFVNKLI